MKYFTSNEDDGASLASKNVNTMKSNLIVDSG